MRKMLVHLAAILLLLGITISVNAQKITPSYANSVAESWIQLKAKDAHFSPVFLDSLTDNKQAVIYRFNLEPSGFIWISANMQFPPVLAYSFENTSANPEDESPAQNFLQTYQTEAIQALSSFSTPSPPHKGWTSLSPANRLKGLKTGEFVEPMMEVTWGQGSGYNTFTPDNTPTGCVAVAMLQIMRHWEWPKIGQGEHSYSHTVYGDFAVNFDTINFNWANLPLNNPNTDIAKIMHYAGIALHMDYAPAGSGANTERTKNLLYTNFRYNENRIRYRSESTFGTSNWIRTLKNELINGRPIIYRGQGTGGHAFNFDGYEEDYFHVNWGWSGSSNGYFLVSSLTPGSSNFSDAHAAVMGIFPDTLMMWDRPFDARAIASDAKVSLAWQGVYNSELRYYNIYRNGEIVGQTSQRTFTDTTPVNDQAYQYSVSALYFTDTADYESELTEEIFVKPSAGFKLPYQQNFEEGYPGWQFSGTARGFKWGTAAELGFGTDTTDHFIGINSGIAGNNVLVSDYLISNGLDFSQSNKVVLSFDYALKKWQDIDHVYLMYRVFEDNEWIEFGELEATKGYHDWVQFKTYLPDGAMKENVELAFYYTDLAEIGYGAGIDNIHITAVSSPGQPAFSVAREEICIGSEAVFTDLSTGTRDTYFWDFGPGADPRYAETAGPHTVMYNSSGSKSVQLVLNGLDELVREEAIVVVRPPSARFNSSINYKTVSFTNTSSNASAYMWDFGDGVKVTQKTPSHAYALSGDYLVRLIAINYTCENDTTQKLVSIKITGIDDKRKEDIIHLYPNPVNDQLNINFSSRLDEELRVLVYSVEGRIVIDQQVDIKPFKDNIKLDVSYLDAGSYFIQLSNPTQVFNGKFIKQD